jgi:Family of unknown function (DUF6088)
MYVVENNIKNRAYGNGRGWCFTPKDFLDLGSEDAVHQALSRLTKKGFVKRLVWGLYEYPRKHPKLGELPPQLNKVIKAIAQKGKLRYQPSGAYAANLLGLSDQVPVKVVLLTDGVSKSVKVGNTEFFFKKTTPKHMLTAGSITGLVIQALKFLGKQHIDDRVVTILRKRLSLKDQKRLKLDYHLAPVWIADLIKNDLIQDVD